jgi:cyclic pyranopterin phosphate synthase
MPRKRKARLAHLAPDGSPRMVNVGAKPVTCRRAVAEAYVTVGRAIASRLRRRGGLAKGDVLVTARLAAIAAAKQTSMLIPMCHPIAIDGIDVGAAVEGTRVRIAVTVSAEARTGVEMEAMVAAAVGALTVYDMVKSAGKGIQIGPVRLLEKEGGKSGRWTRPEGRHAAR